MTVTVSKITSDQVEVLYDQIRKECDQPYDAMFLLVAVACLIASSGQNRSRGDMLSSIIKMAEFCLEPGGVVDQFELTDEPDEAPKPN